MWKYKVVKIYDGDTFLGERNLHFETVRLNWIDAPEIQRSHQELRNITDERQWYWGDRSRKEFENFVENSADPGHIWINEYERDKYGRVLGDVFRDYRYFNKDNLQCHLLRSGLAVNFFPRMDRIVWEKSYPRVRLFCAFLRANYWARKKGRGVWSDPNFMIPYEYRQSWFSP